MPRLTDDEIREAVAVCEKSTTEGPWEVGTCIVAHESGLLIADCYIQTCEEAFRPSMREACANARFIAHARTGYPRALADLQAARTEVSRLRDALSRTNDEISQTLGKALGYPRFSDDQKNFPGATGDDVCVGEHVAETLAMDEKLAFAAKVVSAARRFMARSIPVAMPSEYHELKRILE